MGVAELLVGHWSPPSLLVFWRDHSAALQQRDVNAVSGE
jgi:hypothetical protein